MKSIVMKCDLLESFRGNITRADEALIVRQVVVDGFNRKSGQGIMRRNKIL